MQKEKTITATLVEFTCDCGQGVYRVDQNAKIIHTNPKQWQHICTHCQKEVMLAFPFPIIKHRGEEFVLAKHVRFEGNVYLRGEPNEGN
ncbi:hypothetical protein [Enterovibrio norvegicus]|uniref:hypothetical protein n=1 Tax=Enterovibrio norvegicus TaxID=188144 RepID=UPI0010562966|nr:hypothetical protein [Enterovibrio norvegicus]